MSAENRIVRLLKCILALAAMIVMTSPQGASQSCIECATGCSQTQVSYIYDNQMCSCPTGATCVESGGMCTKCVGGSIIYCFDEFNGCGGRYNNKSNNSCGCKANCTA